MPDYKLPELEQKEDSDDSKPIAEKPDKFPSMYDRKIRIPVNESILHEFSVGDKAEITLTGEIVEVSKSQDYDEREAKTLQLVIEKVSAYPFEQSKEMKEKSFHKGYKKGYSKNM